MKFEQPTKVMELSDIKESNIVLEIWVEYGKVNKKITKLLAIQHTNSINNYKFQTKIDKLYAYKDKLLRDMEIYEEKVKAGEVNAPELSEDAVRALLNY